MFGRAKRFPDPKAEDVPGPGSYNPKINSRIVGPTTFNKSPRQRKNKITEQPMYCETSLKKPQTTRARLEINKHPSTISKSQLTLKDQPMVDLCEGCMKLESHLSENQESMRIIHENNQNLTDQVKTLTSKIEEEALSFQSKLDERDEIIQKYETAMKESEKAANEKDQQLATYNQELLKMQQNFNDNNAALQRLEKENEDQAIKFRSEIDERNSTIAKYEASLKEANLAITLNDDLLKARCDEVTKLEMDLSEQRAIVQRLSQENENLVREAETLKNDLEKNLISSDEVWLIAEENERLQAKLQTYSNMLVQFNELQETIAILQKNQTECADNYATEINGLRNEKKILIEKYHHLERSIEPFKQQIDLFYAEKDRLMANETESGTEIKTLMDKYAALLTHQNPKQKIHHVEKIKEECFKYRQETLDLRKSVAKYKALYESAQDNINKMTGKRRFDPKMAFKFNAVENGATSDDDKKENYF